MNLFLQALVFIYIDKTLVNTYTTQLHYCIQLASMLEADRSCMANAFVVLAIFRSNHWSTTGPSKAVVCCPVCVRVHIKYPLLLI